jgi:hypothetical protein
MPFRKHWQYFVDPDIPNIYGSPHIVYSEVSVAKFFSLSKHLDGRLRKWSDEIAFLR